MVRNGHFQKHQLVKLPLSKPDNIYPPQLHTGGGFTQMWQSLSLSVEIVGDETTDAAKKRDCSWEKCNDLEDHNGSSEAPVSERTVFCPFNETIGAITSGTAWCDAGNWPFIHCFKI